MDSFLAIIKFDYLQRTRTYAFLVTVCISLAFGYSFVPEPNANYSTIRIGDYQGIYNSAWFGYVTAIMTSTFLSLIGFYLINNSIKNDIESKVGQIIASTPVSNFKYLISKVLSNYLLLITIVGLVFMMSILLFFLYNDNAPFEFVQFLKPYVFITLPAMFFISAIAVAFEVVFKNYSSLQNVAYFFFFILLIGLSSRDDFRFSLDAFGSKIVTRQMEEAVKAISSSNENTGLTIGYVIGSSRELMKFTFQGITFPNSFIISRIIWMGLGILITALVALGFHRFNVKERAAPKLKKQEAVLTSSTHEVVLSNLPKITTNYSIFPLIKTELLLLIRKGKRWLWAVNAGGMVALALAPIDVAHQIILPILWFLQVSRIADIITKEISNNVHLIAWSSYKPLSRILTSQVFAGIVLMMFLAAPLLLRLAFISDFLGFFSVVFGGVFIIMLSLVFGVLTQGKKLFEVLFFMLTYANVNKIPVLDYFGGLTNNLGYILVLIMGFAIVGYLKRRFESLNV